MEVSTIGTLWPLRIRLGCTNGGLTDVHIRIQAAIVKPFTHPCTYISYDNCEQNAALEVFARNAPIVPCRR